MLFFIENANSMGIALNTNRNFYISILLTKNVSSQDGGKKNKMMKLEKDVHPDHDVRCVENHFHTNNES